MRVEIKREGRVCFDFSEERELENGWRKNFEGKKKEKILKINLRIKF